MPAFFTNTALYKACYPLQSTKSSNQMKVTYIHFPNYHYFKPRYSYSKSSNLCALRDTFRLIFSPTFLNLSHIFRALFILLSFPRVHLPPSTLLKRAGLPGIQQPNGAYQVSERKFQASPSYRGWTRQPSGRKHVPQLGPTCRVPTSHLYMLSGCQCSLCEPL